MQARQDGEDGFLALEYLLVQRVVGLVELGQSRGAIDDGNGIDVVKLLFAVVDGQSEVLTRSRG